MPVSGGRQERILNVSTGKLSHPLTCRRPPLAGSYFRQKYDFAKSTNRSGSIFPGCLLRLGAKSATLKVARFPMKLRFPLLSAITAVSLITATPQALQAKSDAEQICVSVGRLLEEGHYTHQQLNAEMSQKFLRNYLELLDFSHLFFTQKDVDALTAKYGTALADDVLLGNLKPAYA